MGPRLRLLVIARDASDRAAVAGAASEDLEVTIAAAVAAGKEALASGSFDAVVAGYRAQDAEMLDWLRESNDAGATLPVVVLAAEEVEARAALEAGAHEWLRPEELEARWLRRAVEQARLRLDSMQALRRSYRQALESNAELEAVAQHDPMTGLLNRRGLEQALLREGERARRSSTRLAAVMIDCDDFKRVNDAFGHQVGDRMLVAVADAVKRAVRPTDYVVRLGGDEFLLLLTEVRPEEAGGVAERVRQAIARSEIQIDGAVVSLTSSIGWTWLNDESPTPDRVIAATSEALKRSKALGKDLVTATDFPLESVPPPPSSVARALRRLIESLQAGEQLGVLAQPIVELDSERVVAFELTTRGTSGRFEDPTDFFQLAVENGSAASVDLGCLQAIVRAWRSAPERAEGRAHLNVFPLTLTELGAAPILAQLSVLENGGVGQCCVELSERRMVGAPGHLRDAAAALRDAGVAIALDEVGMSRGALEALVLLRPEFAKIDRRIVNGCADDTAKLRALQRLCEVIGGLSVVPIAVGVESEDDLAMLRALGVRHAQGYLFGRPKVVAAG